MLKGIDPVLSPDLLHVLASMGHGDEIALVDANHPAATVAASTTNGKLIHLSGVTMERAARAILSLMPLDTYVETPIRRMEVVDDPAAWPEVQSSMKNEIEAVLDDPAPMGSLERFAFYEAAKSAFAVVQVSDPRPYGCFLLKKGVISG